MFTSSEWKKLYSDGTVTNWLQQTTNFFMANAGIKDFTPASKYFDPSLRNDEKSDVFRACLTPPTTLPKRLFPYPGRTEVHS